MGVVDQHGDAVLFQQVHPALHLIVEQALADGIVVDAQGPGRSDGRQRVFHIKAARHADAPALLPAVVQGGEGKARLCLFDVCQRPVFVPAVALALAEGDDPLRVGAGTLQHPLCVVHIAVDDGDFAVLHQLQFAGKIVLKVGVLQRADVVLADVEEHSQVKINPIHPVQLVRLGGNLHRQKGQAAVPGLRKVPLQVRGLGGGQVRLVLLGAGVHLDGGEHRAFLGVQLRVAAAAGIEDMLHKVGGGGLALGSGQADQPEVFVGFSIKGDGDQAHRFADVADQDAGNLRRIFLGGEVDARPLCRRVEQVLLLKV